MKKEKLEKKIKKCEVEIWWAKKMLDSPTVFSLEKPKYLKTLKKWEKKLNKLRRRYK